MPEPGYEKQFRHRRGRKPIVRKPSVHGSAADSLLGFGGFVALLPRAWKMLVQFTVVIIILSIVMSLYLGAISRFTWKFFSKINGTETNSPAAPSDAPLEERDQVNR